MIAIDHRYENIQREFAREVRKWRQDTGYSSFTDEIVSHPAYQRIAMGMLAVPLILVAFAKRYWEYWSYALHLITGHTVGPASTFEEIQKRWVEWGEQQGYVDRKTLDRIQKIHQRRQLDNPLQPSNS